MASNAKSVYKQRHSAVMKSMSVLRKVNCRIKLHYIYTHSSGVNLEISTNTLDLKSFRS